jgi:hypothetical protein
VALAEERCNGIRVFGRIDAEADMFDFHDADLHAVF